MKQKKIEHLDQSRSHIADKIAIDREKGAQIETTASREIGDIADLDHPDPIIQQKAKAKDLTRIDTVPNHQHHQTILSPTTDMADHSRLIIGKPTIMIDQNHLVTTKIKIKIGIETDLTQQTDTSHLTDNSSPKMTKKHSK